MTPDPIDSGALLAIVESVKRSFAAKDIFSPPGPKNLQDEFVSAACASGDGKNGKKKGTSKSPPAVLPKKAGFVPDSFP